MRLNGMTHILGVAAVASFAIGCGKGFEPQKFDNSRANTNQVPNQKTQPAERTQNPDLELMSKTVRAVSLLPMEENAVQVDALIHLDDENIYEITAGFEAMENGVPQSTSAQNPVGVRSLIQKSDDETQMMDVVQVMAMCAAECSVVEVNLRFISEDVKAMLNGPMIVTMHFKKDNVAGPYTILRSDAGHAVGSGVQEYTKARILLEGEIEARTFENKDEAESDETVDSDSDTVIEIGDSSSSEAEELQEIDLSTLPKKRGETEEAAQPNLLQRMKKKAQDFFGNKQPQTEGLQEEDSAPKATSASKNGVNQI